MATNPLVAIDANASPSLRAKELRRTAHDLPAPVATLVWLPTADPIRRSWIVQGGATILG